jgi:hypothetical protein
MTVLIVSFGNADWRGILQSVSKRDYLRYISYMAEKNLAAMRKNSSNQVNPMLYQTFIVDMEGLSMNQMAYKPCEFSLFFLIEKCLEFNVFLNLAPIGQKSGKSDSKEFKFQKPITPKVSGESL